MHLHHRPLSGTSRPAQTALNILLAQKENVHVAFWESLQNRTSWTALSLQALFEGGVGFRLFVLCCIM